MRKMTRIRRVLSVAVLPVAAWPSADQGGTEIGDSCKDVGAIATAYEL